MENFEEILNSVNDSLKIKSLRPSTRDLMKQSGVEFYNPCIENYNHILKTFIPFLIEKDFTPTKGGQTYKCFKKEGFGLIYIGYNLFDDIKGTGLKLSMNIITLFIPLYNEEDSTYSSVFELIKKLM